MKRIRIPSDYVAALALVTLGIGVAVIAGIGWSLVVVSSLVLVYIILPDQSPGGPPA